MNKGILIVESQFFDDFTKKYFSASKSRSEQLQSQPIAPDRNRSLTIATDSNRLLPIATDCDRLKPIAVDCSRLQPIATDHNGSRDYNFLNMSIGDLYMAC